MEEFNQEVKTISAKLADIMTECSHVLKNGQNSFHGYRYATCADVLEMVNASLSSHKICSVAMPELLSMDEVTNAKGGRENLATVKIDILLVDSETGETVTISGIGSGQDSGDKAVMKAQTAAIKYAYLLSFAISTGDDPESEKGDNRWSGSRNERSMPFPTDAKKKNALSYDNTDASTAHCSDCGVMISDKVQQYSEKRFGRPLCMNCQHGQRGSA